jgi:hypothetical protein
MDVYLLHPYKKPRDMSLAGYLWLHSMAHVWTKRIHSSQAPANTDIHARRRWYTLFCTNLQRAADACPAFKQPGSAPRKTRTAPITHACATAVQHSWHTRPDQGFEVPPNKYCYSSRLKKEMGGNGLVLHKAHSLCMVTYTRQMDSPLLPASEQP